MRRVLLSSLDGAEGARPSRFEGVQHEFTTAEGVIEDITDIVLNVKGLVFSALTDDVEEAVAHLSIEGPCVVTGADLQVPTEFSADQPRACHRHGRRRRPAGHVHPHRRRPRLRERRAQQALRGLHRGHPRGLAVLARAPLHHERGRTPAWASVQTTTSWCWRWRPTAPSTPPRRCAALRTSSTSTWAPSWACPPTPTTRRPRSLRSSPPKARRSNAELDKQIEDLDLSVRSYNCLKRAGIHSVRQLVEFSENDLLNIRNFGAKSIEEVKDKLISMDLNLKM